MFKSVHMMRIQSIRNVEGFWRILKLVKRVAFSDVSYIQPVEKERFMCYSKEANNEIKNNSYCDVTCKT